MKNCYVLGCNFSSLVDLKGHLKYAGFSVTHREVPIAENFEIGFKVGRECTQADIIFFEFAQWPIEILPHIPKDKKIIVRLKRMELYRDTTIKENIPWNKVDLLICSAKHVEERFIEYRQDKTMPRKIITIPTNTITPDKLQTQPKNFHLPYRFVMAGNVVPKKRQYTAIQMLASLDVPWRLDIVGPTGVLSGYGNDEYLVNLEDLTDELGLLDGTVVYTKWLEKTELAKLYHKCHFVLSLTNEEGSHKAVTEAMSYGCIPLINCWRGAANVYPDKFIFKDMSSFYVLLTETTKKMEVLSKEAQDYVMKRYKIDRINDIYKQEMKEFL